MARPKPLSGFPEWLPEGRLVEQAILDTLRETFELHGFAPVETRSVEPLTELLRKGETSKEVYVLRRLQELGEGPASDDERQLALHFDLTVPLARYVLENGRALDFPFKRYQIQKVWRGERPQDGRFREFTQADIDVVGAEHLPYHYEVELPLVMAEALGRLPIGPVVISVNNRKICEGFYRGLGIDDVDETLRIIDKLDKIGPQAVAATLAERVGASPAQAQACLDLAAISAADSSFAGAVRTLAARYGATNPLIDTGLDELVTLMDAGARRAPGVLRAELKIARGLDYYTGSVYETTLVGHENLGSICSGGRYDNLVSDGATHYPGVGLSIGVTRLVSRLLGTDVVRPSRRVPTAVLVAVADEESRPAADDIATVLRSRGIACETAPAAAKFGKQIRHADRRGIPFVWFAGQDGQPGEVKDIRSGVQVAADPATWQIPDADRRVTLTTTDPGGPARSGAAPQTQHTQ